MKNTRRPLAELRRSAQQRLLIAYAGVIVVTTAALWGGGAWVAESLALQAASQSSAASASSELSCANQILGYGVDIGSAPSGSLPMQLVVDLQQSVRRCDDALQETTRAAAGMSLDQADRSTLERFSLQVDASHGEMSATTSQVIAQTQSGDPAQHALIGAAVTRLATKVATFVDAARAQAAFFSDISGTALVNGRLRLVTIACTVIGIVIFGFIAFIAPLHRRTAALIESTFRSQEQDRRLDSDIARHIAERDRNEAEAQFKALFQQSSVGVVLCGLDGRIMETNAALQGMLGYTSHELRTLHFSALTGDPDDGPANANGDGERLLRRKDESRLWVEQTTTPAIASDDRIVAVIRMIQNIESRKKAENRLHFDATHDALTGLHNRRHFDDAIDEAVNVGRMAHGSCFAVIMIDLDGFKYINDTRGHAVGDAALAEVGRRLGSCDGPNVLISRYGGDEFTAILSGVRTVDTAIALAQAIQSALQEPMAIQGTRVLMSASVGICLWSAEFADGDALLQAADSAVYKAKSAGRGRWAVYDTSMAKDDRYRRAVGANLREALDNGQLDIAFQPIVTLRDRTCIGFEALARWNHPTLGPVPPTVFITVAEEMGLVGEVGEWMLRQACQQLAEWRSRFGVTNIKVNVNVSPQQMADPDFASLVAAALRQADLEPKHIALELTETAIFDSRGQGSKTLAALRRIGTPILLDDFGTGFSSLTHLQKVRMDALKIDQSFVRGEDGGLASPPIVETLIALAKTLGIDVVAEGVETEQQAAQLRALGCEAAQGFLFARPLSAADAIGYLLERSKIAAAS
ncbi:MAG TPA: EAL domain-containing protein [Candidatus Eremiobacteraceae bacterium]